MILSYRLNPSQGVIQETTTGDIEGISSMSFELQSEVQKRGVYRGFYRGVL